MAPAMRYLSGTRRPPRNWVLFLSLVFCVEFWMIVTSAVAQHL
jgi:hypothetical protein